MQRIVPAVLVRTNSRECSRTARWRCGVRAAVTHTSLVVLVAATLALGSGCASTKIESEGPVTKRPLPPVAEILVYDFAYRKDQVSPESALGARLYDLANHESKDEQIDKLGHEVAGELSRMIVEGLGEIGLEARRVSASDSPQPIPSEGVVSIEGQFIDIDAGNRLRRIVIGLGVGRSKLATEVQIFDTVPDGDILVESFSTRARSNLKPGAAETAAVGPAGAGANAAVGVLLEHRSTAMADTRRTGKLIVRHLAALAYQRGWIDYEQAHKVHAPVVAQPSQTPTDEGA